jgi:hypothetical protein
MIEEKIFLNELLKRKERKCEWKYYINELFKPEIISFSSKQISLIKDLLYTNLPNKNRPDFWFIASGAKREMLNNKGYYNSLLKNFPNGTQTPAEEILKLDINRTFPFLEFFKNEENKKKLTNILTAFVRRNATIGYSQGFNFIVGKLLYVVRDEEKVFWIFTQIIENYLPGDFYLLFYGVRKDMKVIEKIIKKELNFLDTNIELCLSNLISKCFISLFSQNIPDQILFTIWDAFFIYGEIILYRAFIWIAYLHYDKSLKNQDIEDINKSIINKMKNTNDINSLYYFLYLYSSINNNLIKQWRNTIESSAQEETMLNRPISNNDIKCNKNMPFCLYNNEENNINKNKQFLVHKTNYDLKIINNYFFDNIKNKENNEKDKNENIENKLNIECSNDLNISANSLIIERQKHICIENN